MMMSPPADDSTPTTTYSTQPLTSKNLTLDMDQFSQLLSPPLTPTEACMHDTYVSNATPLCNQCHQTIGPIYELYAERAELTNKLEDMMSKLKLKEKEIQRYIQKAKRNKVYTEDLEDRYDALADENDQLKTSLNALTQTLHDLQRTCDGLRKESEEKDAELEELSRALFEEANGMVEKEAKLRHASETAEKQLQKQLAESRTRLALQEAHAEDIKARMSMTLTPEIDPNNLLPLLDFVTLAPSSSFQELSALEFVQSVFQQEVIPCLTFPKPPPSSKKIDVQELIHSIFHNLFAMQPISMKTNKEVLECLGCEKEAEYEITEGPKDWLNEKVCRYCRDRIVVVCDYLGFLKNIRSGLYSGQNILVIWLESLRLRHRILYAKLGSIDVLNTTNLKS